MVVLALKAFGAYSLSQGLFPYQLIISFSMFLYKERQQIWISFDSKNSIWRRIRHALKIFDNKDLDSHTFRNKALKDRRDIDIVQGIGTSDASLNNTNCLASLTSCSVHIEPKYTSSEYSGTPRIFFIPSDQEFLLGEPNEKIGHPNPNEEGPRDLEIAHENC